MTSKKWGAVAIAAVAILSLSGCIKTTVHYTLHQDDTVSGELVVAMEKQFTEDMTSEEIEGSIGGDDTLEGIDGVEKQPYDDGSFVGTKTTFENQPLADVASSLEGTLTREGDTFVFQGNPIEPTEFDSLDSSLDSLRESGIPFKDPIVSLSITFPGEITDTNGSVKGTTVTWDLLTLTEAPFATGGAIGTGDSGSGEGIPLWVWLAIGGGAIALVVVIVMLSRRSKDESAPAEAVAPEKPAAKKPADKK